MNIIYLLFLIIIIFGLIFLVIYIDRLINKLYFSLEAWLDEVLSEGGVDSGAHGHLCSLTVGGVAPDALQTHGAAEAQEPRATCTQEAGINSGSVYCSFTDSI